MDAAQTIAPFRVEIRVTSPADAPWIFYTSAKTEAQAHARIGKEKFASLGFDARTVPNTPVSSETIIEDTAETKLLCEQQAQEIMQLRRDNLRLAAKAKAAAMPAPVAVDAIAGLSPLPFAVGDIVRDNHTGVTVRVSAINPPHPRTKEIRPGFQWVALNKKPGEPDATGFVPVHSVGCFVPIREGVPAGSVDDDNAAADLPANGEGR